MPILGDRIVVRQQRKERHASVAGNLRCRRGHTLVLPFLPVALWLSLTPLPLSFLALLAIIVVIYIASAELAKRFFCRVLHE